MPNSAGAATLGGHTPEEVTMSTATGFAAFSSHWPDPAIPSVTLPELLLAGAATRPDAPALVDGTTGRVTSYGELAAAVPRVAAGLAARGLRKGTCSRSSRRTRRSGWSPRTGR
jgi:non-ribosomal peptide synthetase component F